MQKKKIIPFLIVVPMVILAACSSLNLPGTSQGTAQNARTPGAFDPQRMPAVTKLALGTLMLEKTNLAVTPAEAKELLPLWKAEKSLSTSQTASQQEIDALYSQIKETMTPEQVKAIDNNKLTQADIQKTMKDLGIQFPQGGALNLTQDQRATRAAQFQAQNQGQGRTGQGSGGQFGFGAGGNSGFGAGPGGGAFPNQSNASRTPVAGRTGRRNNGFSMIFVNPLITLLETRAGA